jgi:hypothetical protein
MADVYLLTTGEYSDETPAAVFSTLEKAQGQYPVDCEWRELTSEGEQEPHTWWTLIHRGKGKKRYFVGIVSVYRLKLDPKDYQP